MTKREILSFCAAAAKGALLRRQVDQEWRMSLPPTALCLIGHVATNTDVAGAIIADAQARLEFYAFVLKPLEPLPFTYSEYAAVCYTNNWMEGR